MTCKHARIRSFVFEDTGEPAGLWACADCGHKFEPLNLETEKDAARYRWLRGGHGSAAAAQHEEAADKGWERVNWLYDEAVDALIDAEMAASKA